MVSEEYECRFRGSMKMGEQEWDWCFLYNCETLRLDCERCEFKELDLRTSRNRKEVVA